MVAPGLCGARPGHCRAHHAKGENINQELVDREAGVDTLDTLVDREPGVDTLDTLSNTSHWSDG